MWVFHRRELQPGERDGGGAESEEQSGAPGEGRREKESTRINLNMNKSDKIHKNILIFLPVSKQVNLFVSCTKTGAQPTQAYKKTHPHRRTDINIF